MHRPFEVLTETDLRRRSSLKWQYHGPDVLPLWVAEMDVLLADEVIEALTRAVRAGDTGYPGFPHVYAEAFARFAGSRWGWAPDPAETMQCADVMTGIRVLIEQLCLPGSHVVIPSPVYPPFAMTARDLGRQVLTVPLTRQGRWDAAAIGEALSLAGPGSVLLLCNPHNPTGAVHSAPEQQAVAACAVEARAHVIVDEVHAPLVPAPAQFAPWLRATGIGFVVTSAAKAFNLAGLKAGLIVASRAEQSTLRRLPSSVPSGASHLGIIGHTAGYDADPQWLDAVNANIASNRALLEGLLREQLPDVGYRPPAATYLAWLDFGGLGLGDEPADVIRLRGGVGLNHGRPFGPGGAGHARLNFACSEDLLSRAVEGIRSAVAACA